MAAPKTAPTDADVNEYLDTVEDERKRADCHELVALMRDVTGAEPVMWGPSIVGFGSYHYVYASGREGDWPIAGFAPRKRELTLYITAGFERFEPLLTRLGKHRIGASCLYIKRLDDIDRDVLRELVTESVAHMRRAHPTE